VTLTSLHRCVLSATLVAIQVISVTHTFPKHVSHTSFSICVPSLLLIMSRTLQIPLHYHISDLNTIQIPSDLGLNPSSLLIIFHKTYD